jgi:hypothetical protein
MTAPAPAVLRPPLRVVVGALAAIAAVLAAQEVWLPAWTAHAAPAALAVATLAIVGSLLRHARRLDAGAAATWRGFAAVAALLAAGQVLRTPYSPSPAR